jgi:hypothetical protein
VLVLVLGLLVVVEAVGVVLLWLCWLAAGWAAAIASRGLVFGSLLVVGPRIGRFLGVLRR